MNVYMYEDDIHMNMPVEVTMECENKVLNYNDTGERPFVPMLTMKEGYNYNFKRKEKVRRRGRKKNTYVQRTFFLFSNCNPEHFPTKKERIMLTAQGLGKKGPMNINRSWTMAEMDKQLSDMYNIPLLSVMGFSYYKNDIRRKLIKLNVTSVDQLEREVPAGGLVLLVPNHDLPLNNRAIPNGLSAPIKTEIIDDEEVGESHNLKNGELEHVGVSNATQTEQRNHNNEHSLEIPHYSNDNKHTPPSSNFKSEDILTESDNIDGPSQYNSVTKSLRDEIFNLKLQLNSSKQIRASLELQLCRKEEIILKTSDQLAKANEEVWRLKNFIKRLGRSSELPPPPTERPPQNLNTSW